MTTALLLMIPGIALAMALLLPLLPQRPVLLRLAAALAPLLQLLLGLLCWRQPPSDLHQAWLPKLGLALDLGLDGLSLPLVLLAALLTTLAIFVTPMDQSRPRLFFCLLLLRHDWICTNCTKHSSLW